MIGAAGIRVWPINAASASTIAPRNSMKTYSDVKAAIDKLQARAEELRQAEKAGVVSRIREAISVYGITAAELGLAGGGARSAARSSVAAPAPKGQVGVAKYRDPVSGKTWTGRGKPPLWIVGAKDRDAFLINGSGGSSRAAEAPAAKRGRGGKRKAAPVSNVGVAKYRDPASGKTWTGRGKPPLWIAGAKDRQAFLIDGGSSAAPGAADGRAGGRKAQAGRPS
jgi:DNA-binding protein H-NS